MKENICVIVSTPFQLISAFSIAEHNSNYNCDLYVVGNFRNYKIIAEKVKKTAVFADVVTYSLNDIRIGQQSKNAVFRTLMRQWSYIRFNKAGKKIALPNRHYKAVYYAAAVSAAELIMYFQKEYHPQFYLFDDGVMTYRDTKWVTGEGEKFKIIKKTIFRVIGHPIPQILVYSPKLFKAMQPEQTSVGKLPIVSEDAKKHLCNVFDFNSEQSIKEKTIVIECKTSDYLSEDSTNQLENIYKSIIGKTSGESIIFKRHPRDTRPFDSGRKYLSGTVPFELFGCIDDLSSKILIAWDSTAVLTPKLFYNQEPTVILLYKLVKGKINNYEMTDRLYSEFKKIYKNESKFLIIDNEEELTEFMDSLVEV